MKNTESQKQKHEQNKQNKQQAYLDQHSEPSQIDVPQMNYLHGQNLGNSGKRRNNQNEVDADETVITQLHSGEQPNIKSLDRDTVITEQRQSSEDSFYNRQPTQSSRQYHQQQNKPRANDITSGEITDFSGDKEQLNADYRVGSHYLKEIRDHATWSNAQAYYSDKDPKEHTAPEIDLQTYRYNPEGLVQTPYDDGYGAVKSFNYQSTSDNSKERAKAANHFDADNQTKLKNEQETQSLVNKMQPEEIQNAVNSNHYSDLKQEASPFCEHDSLHYCCEDAGINEEKAVNCIQKNMSDQEMAEELGMDEFGARSLRQAFELNGLSDKPEKNKDKQKS